MFVRDPSVLEKRGPKRYFALNAKRNRVAPLSRVSCGVRRAQKKPRDCEVIGILLCWRKGVLWEISVL